MNNSENFYDILGVSKTASQDEIKKAYRQASKKYHPDLQNGKSEAEKKKAEDMFKKCSEAYDVLSDSEKRQQYDRFGRVGNGGQPFDMGSFFQNHSDFFANFFGGGFPGFGNTFGHSSNNTTRNTIYPEDGETLQIPITIDIKDSVYGNEKTIVYNRNVTCTSCNGSGTTGDGKIEVCDVCNGSGMETVVRQQGPMIMQQNFPCRKCGGKGQIIKNPCPECKGNKTISKKETLKIKIPFGIREGNHFVVKGFGNSGKNGGKTGDLIVGIRNVSNNGLFRFRNNSKFDLETDVYINPLESIVGCKKEIFTPSGNVTIDIPANVKNESFIKIANKGINNSGTLFVKIIFDNFKHIPNEIKDEICKILTNSNFDISDNTKLQQEKIERFKS